MRVPGGALGEHTTEAGGDAPAGASWVRIETVLERMRQGPEAPRVPLGRFTVQAVLGRGGMGVVLAAHDPRLDRRVALKLVDDARSDALGEARALARLSHPHIVGVYEVGEVDGVPFIAMELVEGRTLRAWLQADDAPDRRARLEAFLAIARGLHAAHEAGIVHRDFKPDNVLVGRDERPRVVDFGLSRRSGDAEASGRLSGTPAYMAPEQWVGRPADARSDQFAFCVALYEALYDRRPFPGDTLVALMERVTEGEPAEVPAAARDDVRLHAAILRGLRRDPAARWPSMAELVRELEAALGRMQPGLIEHPPAVLGLLMLTNLSPPFAWLGLELAGAVEYDPRGWWWVTTVQLLMTGAAFVVWRKRVAAAFKTPRMVAFPAIFVPMLLGHRVIAWATGSAIETMFVYDFLLAAGAAAAITMLVERAMWPVILVALMLVAIGCLVPAWAPRLWVMMLLAPPMIGWFVTRRIRVRRERALRGGASTRR